MALQVSDDQARCIERAADAGGKYLDRIGKTDLATLSFDEWMLFVRRICEEYEIPF